MIKKTYLLQAMMKITDASSSVYEGKWKDGNMHGKGTWTYSSGDVYEGEWKDGKKHGKGILKDSTNKVIEEGEWINDQFQKQ